MKFSALFAIFCAVFGVAGQTTFPQFSIVKISDNFHPETSQWAFTYEISWPRFEGALRYNIKDVITNHEVNPEQTDDAVQSAQIHVTYIYHGAGGFTPLIETFVNARDDDGTLATSQPRYWGLPNTPQINIAQFGDGVPHSGKVTTVVDLNMNFVFGLEESGSTNTGEYPVESVTLKIFPEQSNNAPDRCKPTFVCDLCAAISRDSEAWIESGDDVTLKFDADLCGCEVWGHYQLQVFATNPAGESAISIGGALGPRFDNDDFSAFQACQDIAEPTVGATNTDAPTSTTTDEPTTTTTTYGPTTTSAVETTTVSVGTTTTEAPGSSSTTQFPGTTTTTTPPGTGTTTTEGPTTTLTSTAASTETSTATTTATTTATSTATSTATTTGTPTFTTGTSTTNPATGSSTVSTTTGSASTVTTEAVTDEPGAAALALPSTVLVAILALFAL